MTNHQSLWFCFPDWPLIESDRMSLNRHRCWVAAAAATLLQSCPTLCDPMDYSLPGSSVHGILQARVLEWVAIAFSVCWVTIELRIFTLHIIISFAYTSLLSKVGTVGTIGTVENQRIGQWTDVWPAHSHLCSETDWKLSILFRGPEIHQWSPLCLEQREGPWLMNRHISHTFQEHFFNVSLMTLDIVNMLMTPKVQFLIQMSPLYLTLVYPPPSKYFWAPIN